VSYSEAKPMIRWDRWAVASMFLINGFIVGSWVPQVPGFVSRVGISEFTFGVLIVGYGLGAICAMALAGQLVARIGSGKTLRLFVVPFICMLPLAAQASELWVAAIVLIMFGCSVGGMDVAMNANVVVVEKQLGRAIMSTSHGFWSLGGFAGGSLGGIAIQYLGAVEHTLFVSALAAIVLAIAYGHINDSVVEQTVSKKHRLSWPKRPGVYIIAAMALLCMSAEGSILNWSALYLQNELMSDTVVMGFAFAGFSGAMALTRFLGDGIRNRFGAVMTFRWSCIVASLGMLSVGLSPWPWLAIVAFAVCGIGMANLIPILFSTAGNQPGVNSGVSVSVVTTIGHVGILLVPSIIGFFAEMVGLSAIFITFAVLLGVLIVLSGRTGVADTN